LLSERLGLSGIAESNNKENFMKRLHFLAVLLGAALLGVGLLAMTPVQASAAAHFKTGGSGYKVSTMPPPGFYYKMYNVFYTADKYIGNDGKNVAGDTKVEAFTQTHRFVWATRTKILGGDLIWDLQVPLSWTKMSSNLTPGKTGDIDNFGLGDPTLYMILAWHDSWYDTAVGVAAIMPMGEYKKSESSVSPGKGYWGIMPSAGATVYFDEARTWNLSAMLRYEISYGQRGTEVMEGDNVHLETGFGKKVNDWLDLAAVAVGSWQVTDSKGKGATNGNHTRKLGFGPEAVIALPARTSLNFRVLFETECRNNPEGVMGTITFSKAF
jgi:hypothetical protein